MSQGAVVKKSSEASEVAVIGRRTIDTKQLMVQQKRRHNITSFIKNNTYKFLY